MKKNYKYLIPIAMVVLMLLGIYTVISNAVSEKKEYNACLAEARKLADLEIIEDSITYYKKALEIRNTLDVNLEIGEVLVKYEWYSDAVEWGEYLLEQYPKEAKVYEFLLEQYINGEQYEECFSLRKEASGRNAKSKEFDELISRIEYVYETGYEMYDDVLVYAHGLCPFQQDGKWGYANEKGKKVIKASFEWTGAFSGDGIAPVKTVNGEYYFIADTGNKKVAVQNITNCTGLGMSIGNILPAADAGVYAYYNQDFEQVVNGAYDMALPMNEGIAAVQKDGKWFFINEKGKTITDKYEQILYDEKGIAFRNGRAFVKNSQVVSMIDNDGKIIGEGYEDAHPFFAEDGYAAVVVNGKWGFIDKDGEMKIEPQFDDARSFMNGLAAVEKNGKWGYITESGTIAIDYSFEGAKEFNSKGIAFIKMMDKWITIKLLRSSVD